MRLNGIDCDALRTSHTLVFYIAYVYPVLSVRVG
jgi:hypothetical protein